MAAVGSSIRRMRACSDSALAISTSCICATLSSATGVAGAASSPTISIHGVASRLIAA